MQTSEHYKLWGVGSSVLFTLPGWLVKSGVKRWKEIPWAIASCAQFKMLGGAIIKGCRFSPFQIVQSSWKEMSLHGGGVAHVEGIHGLLGSLSSEGKGNCSCLFWYICLNCSAEGQKEIEEPLVEFHSQWFQCMHWLWLSNVVIGQEISQ